MPRHATLSPADTDAASAAAQRVVQTHQRLADFLRRGQTLAQIDAFVAKTLADLDCRSCFLGYKVPRSPAFPSHACLSVNECVVHGTAGYLPRPLQAGDLLKIDVGVTHKGWIGDAAWTYFFGPGPMPETIKRLTDSGKQSLRRGIEQLRPGNTYLAWAQAVQKCVEQEYGFHLIRGLGGHGYGRRLHDAPFISNVVPTNPHEWPDAFTRCEPGALVAVEPMIATGTGLTMQHGRQWPVFTRDGSVSVHYEHDVLITENGPRILTEGMENLPDIVG